MAKKKATLYEEMVFDDVQLAVDTYNECKAKLKKVESALGIAIVATVCSGIGFFLGQEIDILAFLMLVGFVCSIIAYVKGGGFGTAIKWAWKLAVFGWIIIPFPFDIVVGMFTMAFAVMAFFFIPVVFVYMNYRQVKKDFASAQKYISYFKAKAQPQVKSNVTSNVTSNVSRASANRSYASQSGNQTSGTRTYTSSPRTQTSVTRTYGSTARTQASGTRVYR